MLGIVRVWLVRRIRTGSFSDVRTAIAKLAATGEYEALARALPARGWSILADLAAAADYATLETVCRATANFSGYSGYVVPHHFELSFRCALLLASGGRLDTLQPFCDLMVKYGDYSLQAPDLQCHWEGKRQSAVPIVDMEVRGLGSAAIPALLQGVSRHTRAAKEPSMRAFDLLANQFDSLPPDAQKTLTDFAYSKLAAKPLSDKAAEWCSHAEALLLVARDQRLLSHMMQKSWPKDDDLSKSFRHLDAPRFPVLLSKLRGLTGITDARESAKIYRIARSAVTDMDRETKHEFLEFFLQDPYTQPHLITEFCDALADQIDSHVKTKAIDYLIGRQTNLRWVARQLAGPNTQDAERQLLEIAQRCPSRDLPGVWDEVKGRKDDLIVEPLWNRLSQISLDSGRLIEMLSEIGRLRKPPADAEIFVSGTPQSPTSAPLHILINNLARLRYSGSIDDEASARRLIVSVLAIIANERLEGAPDELLTTMANINDIRSEYQVEREWNDGSGYISSHTETKILDCSPIRAAAVAEMARRGRTDTGRQTVSA